MLNSNTVVMVLLALGVQLLSPQSVNATGLTTRLHPASSLNSLSQPPPPTTTESPDATTTLAPVEVITSMPGKKKPIDDLIDRLQDKIRATPDILMEALLQLKQNIKLLVDAIPKPYKPKSFDSRSFPARESRLDRV